MSREDAEAEAAAELRRVMERAGVPVPPSVGTPAPPAATDEGRAAEPHRPVPPPVPPPPEAAEPEPPPEPPPAEAPAGAPPQAVRRVRKSPPGAGRGRS